MKKIKVLSIEDICSHNLKLNENILVISFFNSNDFSIVEKQKYFIRTNPSILDFENNIFSLQKDDITKLSFYQKLKHNISPYINIFSKYDTESIINFLKENNYIEKDIYIQCEYGKSRLLSTAIALEKYFLNKTHKLEHKESIVRNKIIYDYIKTYLEKR